VLPYDELLDRLRTTDADCWTGEPGSAEAIRAAELRLGVTFPPSYRRFLEVLGSAEAGGREVFGLSAPGEPQVVTESVQHRAEQLAPPTAVVIEIDVVEGTPVGFVPPGDGSEPAIVRWDGDRAVPIATDFEDYLSSLAGEVLPAQADTSAAPAFDPPWGQRRVDGGVEADRKEVKLAYTLVQRIKYDGVSWAQLVKELNSRRIPARGLGVWTAELAREAYEAWKDRY
jgi:hypothetical protein